MSAAEHSLWRPNVAAIVTDDAGQILLAGRPERSQRWHFPQGGIKPGESATEALRRELREEVGLCRYTILAAYPGLRYEYRRKNEKTERWLGQQQTYFLLHCPGIAPALDCSGSEEFSTVRWLPLPQVQPKLFPSFKREAVMRALEHFFPGGQPFSPAKSTPQLYAVTPGIPPAPPAPGTPLLAGGKTEATCHMAQLSPRRPGKQQRLFVVLLGMQGSGMKKALRAAAPALDALTTRYASDKRRYAGLPSELLPLPGELSILALPSTAAEAAQLAPLLARLQAEGAHTLCLGLHVGADKQQRRLAEKDKTPDCPWQQDWDTLRERLATLPGPAYLLPTDCGWYRDFLVCSLIGALVEP